MSRLATLVSPRGLGIALSLSLCTTILAQQPVQELRRGVSGDRPRAQADPVPLSPRQDPPPTLPRGSGSRRSGNPWKTQDELTQDDLERLAREIQSDLERMRDREFVRPVRVLLLERDPFLDRLVTQNRRSAAPMRLAAEESAAKLLGLLPAIVDLEGTSREVLQEQIGGFYDPGTDAIYLCRGTSASHTRVTLAHELVNAFDDQLHRVHERRARFAGRSDAALAFEAVVEGSRAHTLYRWIRENRGKLAFKDLQDMPGMESSALGKAPEYIWKPWTCTYLRGPAFLARTDNVNRLGRVDFEDVERVLHDPPTSSEQILHPDKYWSERERDDPRSIEFDLERLPAGWAAQDIDSLGELGLCLFTTPFDERGNVDGTDPLALCKVEYSNDAASGWGGDRYLLLRRGRARVLVLVTLWDSDRDAGEFLAAAEELRPRLIEAVQRYGHEVVPDLASGGCFTGCRVDEGSSSDEVVWTSWVGLSIPELEQVLDGLHWRESLVQAQKED